MEFSTAARVSAATSFVIAYAPATMAWSGSSLDIWWFAPAILLLTRHCGPSPFPGCDQTVYLHPS
jgi:hypothetical protein